MYYLLGIDDTDSIESVNQLKPPADTSTLAVSLGLEFENRGLAKLINISCHQLLQHPSIPHTTQNTSFCLLLDADVNRIREVELVCREILLHECAPHSNPGYVLAPWNSFDPEIVAWGKTAKINKLNRQEAISLGRNHQISIAGITGSGAGVIGALAAVGLRYEGNDGWITWMPGLKSLFGVYTQSQLSQIIHFDRIESDRHRHPAMDDRIQINKPLYPLIKEGKIVLFLFAAKNGSQFEWYS